jgi:hypothetical protein
MGCEYYDDEYEELEEEEDFEEDDEEEEEEEVYYYIKGVERRGNIIVIKVGVVDVCCPATIEITLQDALNLVKMLVKNLNKDEVTRLLSTIIDGVTSK